MDAISLVVEVPLGAAVREGTGRAGRAAVALSPEVLGALSPPLRELLAGALRAETADGRPTGAHLLALGAAGDEAARPLPLPTADTSARAVAEALRGSLERELARRAEAAACERSAEADRAAILAHARAAVGEAPASPWRDVVLLAEEGYDFVAGAADLIVDQVRGGLTPDVAGRPIHVHVDGTKSGNWTSEPRANPRPEAVALARAIRASVARVPLPARGVVVEVLPVLRVTRGGRKGERFTAVCIEVRVTGAARRRILVEAEPRSP